MVALEPIGIVLERAVAGDRTRIFIIGKYDPVSDEYPVFDCHSFTDKRMARNFTIATNCGVALDLDEGADFGIVADGTTVQVYKICHGDVDAHGDVPGNAPEITHFYPSPRSLPPRHDYGSIRAA